MALTLVTAPADPVITLEDARAHLRIDACGSPATHPDDALVELLVQVVTSELDGVDGWLGRALVAQTWKLTLDEFPGNNGRIYLPLTSPKYDGSPAPVVVQSVKYLDADGVEVTLVEGTDYRVVTENDPIFIEPVYDTSWPDTRQTSAAVSVVYFAGYGDPEDVPSLIRSYMLVRMGQLYEFRELVVAGTIIAELPFLRDSLECMRLRGYA